MTFVQYSYSGEKYVYEDEFDTRTAIAKRTLLIVWYVHGYLRNPLTRKPLTEQEIEDLLRLADQFDTGFAGEIRKYLPRHCSVKERQDQFQIEFAGKTEAEIEQYRTVFLWLLTIGLYLIGWSGIPEDVPTTIHPTHDIVMDHLKILPYVRAVNNAPEFATIRKIGIVGKYCHSNYTMGSLWNEMNDVDIHDLSFHGRHLIVTVSHYLTNFLHYPIDALVPLIKQIEQEI